MTEKDYTLLRPFDLEKAKAGEPLCSYTGNLTRDYVAGPDASGRIVVSIEGNFNVHRPDDIRMAPLAWVEGKPVYKGDVLCYKGYHEKARVETKSAMTDALVVQSERFGLCAESIDDLTWTTPKVKREGWINLYAPTASRLSACSSSVYKTESIANDMAAEGRIACARVEWEE